MEALVRDIMKIGVLTCRRDDKLPAVAKSMAREDADAVIVMDDYGACGVVSQSDLVRAFPRNFELLTAQDVMTDKIISVAPDAPVTAAANIMQDEGVHQLFVMHEHPGPSRPSAVVTMHAIVRAMGGLDPARPQLVKPKRK
jgi:CBS domain-containing protein